MDAVGGYAAQAAALWHQWDEVASEWLFAQIEAGFGEDIRHSGALYVKSMPKICQTPTLTMTCTIAYVVFVVLAKLLVRSKPTGGKGKKKAESPAWLKWLVYAHNLFLVVLSSYMSGGIIIQAIRLRYRFWGQLYDEREVDLARLIAIFTFSKLYEYLDTVIMVLKGNMHQVSFLHCYHHVSVSIFWWLIMYVMPGGEAWFSSSLNSFVHVVMYTYYLLASASSGDETFRKRYLWWGKYLTSFQMAQFAANGVHCAYMYYFGTFSAFLSKIGFFYMISLWLLFAQFYVQKYLSSSTSKSKKKKKV